MDTEKKITEILKELGIPMGNLGYRYIKEAVSMIAEDDEWLQMITNPDGLYATIGKKFGTKGTRVERAIRHAIEGCFSHGNTETIQKYFGYTANMATGKLTNKNFIAALAGEVGSAGRVETSNENSHPDKAECRLAHTPLSDYSDAELITELFSRIRN